jgi:hypothetical protein
MKAGERRCLPRGRVAHIVVSDDDELWEDEAMTICGQLVLDTDRVAPRNAKTCKYCAAGKRRTPEQIEGSVK